MSRDFRAFFYKYIFISKIFFGFGNHSDINQESNMRCKNCGWNNQESSPKCEKCNAPLEGSMIQQSSMPLEYGYEEVKKKPRKTRMENTPFDIGECEKSTCPHCGYLVIKDYSGTCPNCNKLLNLSQEKKEQHHTTQSVLLENYRICLKCQCKNPANALFCSNCGSQLPTSKNTVNPWEMLDRATTCSLEMLSSIDGSTVEATMDYSGEEIILNRENTEPKNQTITSKQQAVIIREEAKWYILDKSELRSTYVHAGSKRELHSGDIIILGNRKFKFEGK